MGVASGQINTPVFYVCLHYRLTIFLHGWGFKYWYAANQSLANQYNRILHCQVVVICFQLFPLSAAPALLGAVLSRNKEKQLLIN